MLNPLKTEQLPIRLVLDAVGSDSFVGVYTTRNLTDKEEVKKAKEEIDRFYNGCYNHGVTGGELRWMHDGFAYFGTDKTRLAKGFLEKEVTAAKWAGAKESETQLEKRLKGRIKKYIAEIPREPFVQSIRKHYRLKESEIV
jgi:hypothetical protein